MSWRRARGVSRAEWEIRACKPGFFGASRAASVAIRSVAIVALFSQRCMKQTITAILGRATGIATIHSGVVSVVAVFTVVRPPRSFAAASAR